MKQNQQNLDASKNLVDAEKLPTFDTLIAMEVKKFDSVTPAIEELKKEYMPLKINGLDDVAGYEKVYKAYRNMVSKRTAVENKRKELKEDSVKFGKAVDAKAKEITALLSPIEIHLKDEKEKIDNEKERVRLLEEERVKKIINQRHIELYNLGMNKGVNGNDYIIVSQFDYNKKEVLSAINLEIMSDEMWAFTVNKIKAFVQADLDIKIAKEKEKQEQEAKIAEERKKLLEEQEKINLEKQLMLKQQQEFKSQRFELRLLQLKEQGVNLVTNTLTNKQELCWNGYCLCTKDDIYELDNEAFGNTKKLIDEKIESVIQSQKEFQESQRIIAENKMKEKIQQNIILGQEKKKEIAEQAQRDIDEKRQEEVEQSVPKLNLKPFVVNAPITEIEFQFNDTPVESDNDNGINDDSTNDNSTFDDEAKYLKYVFAIKNINQPTMKNVFYSFKMTVIKKFLETL